MAVNWPVRVHPGTLGATEPPSVPGAASASPLTIRFLPALENATVGAAADGEATGGVAALAGEGLEGGAPHAATSRGKSVPSASGRAIRAWRWCSGMGGSLASGA